MNTYEIFELSSVLIIIIIAIIILIVFGVVLSDILSFILESGNISELYKLTRYLDIKLGMSENKMLNIMGG